MAFKSTSYLRSLFGRLRGSATYATSTTQELKASAPTSDYGHARPSSKLKLPMRGDFVPVYVALGMICFSVSLGLHAATQQLKYSPSVRVNKKTRETIPEVYLPDKVNDEAVNFIKKSFFRKVAHVQASESGLQYVPDSIRKDVYANQPRVETLKHVGIEPTPPPLH
ncbi:hypothetical protein CFOL_v3_26245 [Cephalotus follicularis]|uniref:Uncharacterized protein n=1 Tax=Cephalotus follicularis TaxID=3775 RepID=A0A1Q3CRC3_CEPFO|nr:hypothetical protein CFOL_v3_26245 [Cephalotus follicularis]